MPSTYLQSADYAAYGVPNASAAQIQQASTLIDAYLLRPQGLLYIADPSGQPCYMSALSTELTLNSSGSFSAGSGVTIPATGPLAMLQVGDCVVLDRATPSVVEATQVTNINTTAGTLTLGTVQYAHSSNCTIETGMLITEKRYLPKGRSEVILANAPVARIVGGTGRYGYGRRGDAADYDMDNFNLLASLNKFGGPPAWEIWPANTAAGIDAGTGQLWVPAGIMLAYYSEVKVRYVAGFQYSNLPSQIKLACAQLITALTSNPVLGNVKSYKAGDTAIAQFASTVISDDIKSLLQPWRVKAFA